MVKIYYSLLWCFSCVHPQDYMLEDVYDRKKDKFFQLGLFFAIYQNHSSEKEKK